MMLIRPIEHTLRGFHFDGSSFDSKSFYVDAFFMPLYVPVKQVHFTFGRRLRYRGGDRWNIQDFGLESKLESAMKNEVPFLSGLREPKNLVAALMPLTVPNAAGYVNLHCYEALAYALEQADETDAAIKTLDRLMKNANPRVQWESDIVSRARLIRDKLIYDRGSVRKQLALWEEDTVRYLGLDNRRA